MKPFNLEKALAGEPVETRDGRKAIVFHRIPDIYKNEHGSNISFPLVGMIFDADGTVDDPCATWRDNGSFASDSSGKDIVGMYEEPKLTTEELMEKAFQEKLLLTHNLLPSYCKGFKVVGKTLDNNYILLDCDNFTLHFLRIFDEHIEWLLKE